MPTVKEMVLKALARHQSGAIEISQKTERGASPLNQEDWKTLISAGLTANIVIVSRYEQSGAPDIRYCSDKQLVEPLTDAGWRFLETLGRYGLEQYRLEINSQEDVFAYSNFGELGGDLSFDRDKQRLARERAEMESDRLFAGYGKSRMGGWIEM